MPSETATAACCMTMGGVLERFPKLKVCFAHGGGAFPYTLGRIAHGHAVRPDLCAVENTISPRSVSYVIYSLTCFLWVCMCIHVHTLFLSLIHKSMCICACMSTVPFHTVFVISL